MKPIKNRLTKQLLSIALISIIIIAISLGLFLPNALLPVYENNLYNYLSLPLELIDEDISEFDFGDIGYMFLTPKQIHISENYNDIINLKPEEVFKKIKDDHGKFLHNGKTYYYYTKKGSELLRVTIANDTLITKIKGDILKVIFPLLLITLLVISALLVWWSHRLVRKIEDLKEAVDNIDNDDYKPTACYTMDDELAVLSEAIDNMKVNIKNNEKYRNQMYQNISHDFKTPLVVIKSYVEATEDGIVTEAEALSVIKDQTEKLETKVHSLLYLNKLNYIKSSYDFSNDETDIIKVINDSVAKFKMTRTDIKWRISIKETKRMMCGSVDMWEAITDNLLSNFVRYAESTIKITVTNSKITFFNDGPNIDHEITKNIFTPYKKGIKGEFGLGLSVVKETANLLGYEVKVYNEKKGVSFVVE